MSDCMTPVDRNSPRWRAWTAYRESEKYENAVRWITEDPSKYAEGQLWSAFVAGYNSRRVTAAEYTHKALDAFSGLSKEREAEIRGITQVAYPDRTKQAIRELLAELDKLRKRVDNLEARTGDLDGETP